MANAAIPFPSRYPNYIVRCLRNQWPPRICYTQTPSIQAGSISFQRIYPLPRSLPKFRNRTVKADSHIACRSHAVPLSV